jgi:hypothetical protein
MNEHSELFLLLPESETNSTSAFLICKSDKTTEELSSIINKIGEVPSFFEYEKCTMLYDSRNRDAFNDLLQKVDNPKDYIKLSDAFVAVLGNRKWINWRDIPEQKPDDEYKMEGAPIADNSFCEGIKRLSLHHDTNTYFFVNATDYVPKCSCAKLSCKSSSERYTTNMMVCELEIKDIYNWFVENRRPIRKYLPNNEKHGEGGKAARKAQKGKSVGILLCTNEEAEGLLRKAIGKSPLCKKLFCYDKVKKKYIQFMNSAQPGVAGLYHAFHIEETDFRSNEFCIKEKLDKLKD